MRTKTSFLSAVLLLLTATATHANTAAHANIFPRHIAELTPQNVQISFQGRVVDAQSGEALPGVTLRLDPPGKTIASGVDGGFSFSSLTQRTYTLTAFCLGYHKVSLTVNPAKLDSVLVIRMQEKDTSLGTATVTAQSKKNTEKSVVSTQKNSLVVQSGVSSEQIAKTQDKDASEVIRRVPGISIIEQKFVMVRGLSQRYNNVWMNGAAVPSTEADTRSFSFDLIPSSQVSNMQIIKSPAPQYPADFTGGFILIDTKDVPGSNEMKISVGAGMNDQTHFRSFLSGRTGGLDFLGFDNFRSLDGGIHAPLPLTPGGSGIDLNRSGLTNDWTVRSKHVRPDLNLGYDLSHSFDFTSGAVLGLLAALNYSNSFQTYAPMENSLFGAYDRTNDQSVYLRHATDRQYSNNVRLGGMLNLTFIPAKGAGKYEWKHIFNRLATSRYTERDGFNAQSNKIHEAEYYYSGRTTYNTQVTGKFVWNHDRFDWSAGYAYANRDLPDRRRYTLDNQLDPARIGLTTGNDLSREFTYLKEHIASLGANYRHDFEFSNFKPELLAGAYGEYRSRNYDTRSFIYQWNPEQNTLPRDFRYLDLTTELLTPENYGDDGLYLTDDTKMRNDYRGRHLIASGYAAANLPFGAFSLYAGVRFEHSSMELIRNTRDYERNWESRFYDSNDFFPSANMTYRFNARHQLRASYGRSVNRPEFREVSPSVYYDFDLASSVQGNANLKSCYVHNADLRYEWYPSEGEQISLALFYKHFDAPIEWTYTVSGGTDLIYSYENADRATSYGVELDIRKNLAFIGLKDFTLVANASLIKSRVKFSDASQQRSRPMQGQSPYLVNVGLFYQKEDWSASAQYNVIGKRLIGVGRNLGSTGDQTVSIPDAYEMPRHLLDLNVSKTFGRFTLKAGIKDVLAQKVIFKQFNDVITQSGERKTVEEVTRSYRPGRNISLTLTYKL